MTRTRRWSLLLAAMAGVVLLGAQPAMACGGLVGPGGTVQLGRTTTLAGYHDGVEHYLTSFTYTGGGARFGSIVPLPGVPDDVRKGGEWTLQRLVRETQPQPEALRTATFTADSSQAAEELLTTRVDALDITVLRGGGRAVGDWAREHGFGLSVDAPEVLDFYASRSPIFLAAAFDGDAAAERGQQLGDGTPVHITIPTDNPWVPLRILALGKTGEERVEADVFLLTDEAPALLPAPGGGDDGMRLDHSAAATTSLLDDLRSDRGMEWIPSDAWLTKVAIDAAAASLSYDLAIDASGAGAPSPVDAGFTLVTVGDVVQLAREQGIDVGRALLAVVLSLIGAAGVMVAAGFRPGGERR